MRSRWHIVASLSFTTGVFIVGCSAGNLLDLAGPLGKSTPAPSTNPSAAAGLDDYEIEVPPVNVAGVNLVTECELLPVTGDLPDTQSLECTIAGDDKSRTLVASNPKLESSGTELISEASGTSAQYASSISNDMLVSARAPVGYHFDVPISKVSDLKKKNLEMVFESFVFPGRSQLKNIRLPVAIITNKRPNVCDGVDWKKKDLDLKLPEAKSFSFLSPDLLRTGEKNLARLDVQLSLAGLKDSERDKIKICSVRFKDELKVRWDEDFAQPPRFLLSLGDLQLYSSLGNAPGAYFVNDKARKTKRNIDDFNESLKSVFSFLDSTWTIARANNLVRKSDDDEYLFDLNRIQQDVLVTALNIMISSSQPQRLKLSTYEFFDVDLRSGTGVPQNAPRLEKGEVELEIQYVKYR